MAQSDGETVFEVDAPAGALTVEGNLGFGVERRFERACWELFLSDRPELFVDLSATRYISSSCLGTLFLLHDRSKSRGKSVRVRVHKSTAPICELMGLGEFVELEVVG